MKTNSFNLDMAPAYKAVMAEEQHNSIDTFNYRERDFVELVADLSGVSAVLSIIQRDIDEGEMIETKALVSAIYAAAGIVDRVIGDMNDLEVRHMNMLRDYKNVCEKLFKYEDNHCVQAG